MAVQVLTSASATLPSLNSPSSRFFLRWLQGEGGGGRGKEDPRFCMVTGRHLMGLVQPSYQPAGRNCLEAA